MKTIELKKIQQDARVEAMIGALEAGNQEYALWNARLAFGAPSKIGKIMKGSIFG